MSSKAAEVGDVPEHWDVTELIEFLGRITYGFTNPMPDADEGPWKITAKDVVNGYINYDTARKTTPEAFAEKLTDKSRPNVGDVLLTKDGSIGRVAVVDRDNICINQSVALLQPNRKIYSHFLKYLLMAPHYQKVMIGDSDGAVIKHIYITRVDKMEVAVPPLEEQKAVLEVVKTIDDKILNCQAINQTVEQIAQAVFKCWFVDFEPVKAKQHLRALGGNDEQTERAAQAVIAGAVNLDVITTTTDLRALDSQLIEALSEKLAHQTDAQREQLATTASHFPDQLVESELGLIPEGWETGKVADVVKRLKAGKRYTKKQVVADGLVPVFEQGADILLGYHNDKPGFVASVNEPLFIFGDHTCITHVSCQPFDISQNVIPVEGDGFPTIWVYYAVKDLQQFQEYRRHWSEFIIKDVVLPNQALAAAFSEMVSDFLEFNESAVRQTRSLSFVRDALLPKLLSGELPIEKVA